MMPMGSKLARPRGGGGVCHMLEHRTKEDQLQNSSRLKLEGVELESISR